MRNLMKWLTWPVRLLGARSAERGGIGVLVAVVLGGGVLLGMGALAIDVGQIYQNRAELQNGADAGALAVAKSCALGSCNSGAAGNYATANASALTGNNAGVDLVCGTSTLPGCPAPVTGDMTDCPPIPSVGNFVDVHTSTQLASGSTVLPPVFAETLVGSTTFSGTHVKACAQASWGPALQANSLAITISLCAWNSLTVGNQFGPTHPVAVYLKGKGNSTCFGPAGSVPGGFDWLSPTSSGVCQALIDLTTDTTYSDTGNDTSAACKTSAYNDSVAYAAGHPVTVFLPIFDAVTGSGGNLQYHIIGLAGFVVTGYSDLSGGAGSGLPKAYGQNNLCTQNDPCIQGYFMPGIDPVTSIGGGTNFGALAVRLTG
jgi:Flp pilus assembly protein TadG